MGEFDAWAMNGTAVFGTRSSHAPGRCENTTSQRAATWSILTAVNWKARPPMQRELADRAEAEEASDH
jgi:hypothetical protein